MKMIFYSLVKLSFLFALSAKATTNIQINSPLDGFDIRNETKLELAYTINSLDVIDQGAKIVVFRMNNHAWPRIQELPIDTRTGGHVTIATPAKYFCDDLYAIRIMNGDRTLAGPVHFYAGAGACSHPDRSKFLNLEENLVDLQIYKPANQQDRDTCGSFATAAALSAAYKREKGINLLMSQQFLHHLVKSSSYGGVPFYLYENQASLWGGNSLTDAFKIIKYYAAPSDAYAPYLNNTQMWDVVANLGLGNMYWNPNPQLNRVPQLHVDLLEYDERHIPMYARQVAIYGATNTVMVRKALATDTNRIETWLRSNREVVLGLDLKWMPSTTKAKTMLYNNASGGGHMMLIVGYDKTDAANPYFLIKNSWGDGVLRVHYDVIRNQTNSEIGFIESVRDINTFHPTRWFGAWNMKHDHWVGKLYIRRAYELMLDRYDGYLRIGEYHHQNGQRYCAYGDWDAPARKLMMKINFDKPIQNSYYDVKWDPIRPAVRVLAKDVCPAEAQGQYFELNMSNNVHRNAYGHTIWNNINFPAEIWR